LETFDELLDPCRNMAFPGRNQAAAYGLWGRMPELEINSAMTVPATRPFAKKLFDGIFPLEDWRRPSAWSMQKKRGEQDP
jgi:hypothetical protein